MAKPHFDTNSALKMCYMHYDINMAFAGIFCPKYSIKVICGIIWSKNISAHQMTNMAANVMEETNKQKRVILHLCIKYTDPVLEMPLQTPADDETAFSQHASNQGSINKPAGFMQKARVYISNTLFKHMISNLCLLSDFCRSEQHLK